MRRFFWIGILVVLAVVVAFLAFDFILARSATNVERQSAVYSTGSGDAVAPSLVTIGYSVEGQTGLAGALREVLPARLAAAEAIVAAQRIAEPGPDEDVPYMVVDIESQSLFWSPIYARADVVVRAAYATHGDVSWRWQEGAVHMEMGEGPRMEAEFHLTDRSWGLISLPGYRRLVAGRVGAEIAAVLNDVVQGDR